MKKVVILLLCVLFSLHMVSASVGSTSIQLSNGVNAQIEVLKYQPSPVEPGEFFDLWVAVELQGGSSSDNIINLDNLQDVELEFVEQYPFSLDADEDAVHSLGVLRMGEQAVAQYRVKVDHDANFGDNELTFIFRSSDDPEGIESSPLDISIHALDETMNVVEISTDPEQLSPGKPAVLDISIQNDALGAFKILKLSSTLTIQMSLSFLTKQAGSRPCEV